MKEDVTMGYMNLATKLREYERLVPGNRGKEHMEICLMVFNNPKLLADVISYGYVNYGIGEKKCPQSINGDATVL